MPKTQIYSVIAFASIIMVSLPVFAGETLAESNQITVINGGGNYANQNSNQSINYSGNGRDAGVKLKNTQVCDIVGNDNTCANNNQQRVDIYNGHYRGKRK
jgi:hypothetical protein